MDGEILAFVAVSDRSPGAFVHIFVVEMQGNIRSGIGRVVPQEVECFAVLFKAANNTLTCGSNTLRLGFPSPVSCQSVGTPYTPAV